MSSSGAVDDFVQAIGIDEIAWQRGHKYLTLVYQIDAHCKRLLWVGNKRKIKTLLGFFRWFGRERSAALKYVCSDMWKPYLKVIAKKAGQAVHVLDRFHIMMHFSKALDAVRAEESKALKAKGYEPLAAAEATGEPHRQAGHPPCRAPAIQPPVRPRLSAEGGVPVLLELRFPLLGGTLPGSMVHEDDAIEDLADEESRQDAT